MNIISFIMPVVTYPHVTIASGSLKQGLVIMFSFASAGFLVSLAGIGISIYDELSDDRIYRERGVFIVFAGLSLAAIGVLYMLFCLIINAI